MRTGWLGPAFAALVLLTQPAAADEALGRIKNIVVIYAENRSFDHLYGAFPGANGLGNATEEIDFCYGWTLWMFLSWIPSFFFQNFHLNLKDSALFSAGVFLSGVIGDTLGGVMSDMILKRTGNLRAARCRVIAGGLFGGFVFMFPVVLMHDLTVVALCLSAAFFCVELVVAPIWAAYGHRAPTPDRRAA